MKKILIAALGLGFGANAAENISVVGSCQREVKAKSTKVATSEIDINKLVSDGLKIASKAIEKTQKAMAEAPKKEYAGNFSFSYKDKTDGTSKDFEMPFNIAIPKLSDEQWNDLFDDIAEDTPELDDAIQVSAKMGIDEKKLEAEYKACAKDAMADAKEKAEVMAVERNVELGKVISVKQDANVEATSAGEGTLRLKVDVVFGTK